MKKQPTTKSCMCYTDVLHRNDTAVNHLRKAETQSHRDYAALMGWTNESNTAKNTL